jgi:hypothetical protein
MHEREDLRLGTREEYIRLFNKYWQKEDMPLGVYSSYTRMDGDWFGEGCRIETVWGFKGEDVAVIGLRRAGDTYETCKDEQYWVNDQLLQQIKET